MRELQDYKGYKYKPWEDYEEDNVKIFHDVIGPNGEDYYMDWSPYSWPSQEDFELWVDLERPPRKTLDHGGPLRHEDLIQIKKMIPNSIKYVKKLAKEEI